MNNKERTLYLLHCSKRHRFITIASKYLEVEERLRITGRFLDKKEEPVYNFIKKTILLRWNEQKC